MHVMRFIIHIEYIINIILVSLYAVNIAYEAQEVNVSSGPAVVEGKQKSENWAIHAHSKQGSYCLPNTGCCHMGIQTRVCQIF